MGVSSEDFTATTSLRGFGLRGNQEKREGIDARRKKRIQRQKNLGQKNNDRGIYFFAPNFFAILLVAASGLFDF
jgi:hypothetical protein